MGRRAAEDAPPKGTGTACAIDLGPGWKISPSVDIDGDVVIELAAVDGPGRSPTSRLTTHRDNWRCSYVSCRA